MELIDVIIIATGTLLISSFNAAIGPTGGIQLAIVAALLPPALSIPVHGIISGLSSFTRLYRLRNYVNWSLVFRFCSGSIIGTIIALSIFVQIQDGILLMLIGCFILVNNHIKYQNLISNRNVAYLDFIVGLLTGGLTIFVGATGLAVFTYIAASDKNRLSVLGTDAACMTFQHLTKIIGFALLTFTISAYWLPLLIFAICAIIGTNLGVKLVHKIPEHLFRLAFKSITSLVGIYLIGAGIYSLH